MTLKKLRMSGAAVRLAFSVGLALLATGSSLSIAIEASRRLGSRPDTALFPAVVVIVAVLVTHLLLPILGQTSARRRLGAFLLSIACASLVVYLHVNYVLLGQAEAGERRMAAAASSDVHEGGRARVPRRGASQVLSELADVKADHARLRSRICAADCARFDARDAVLRERISVLEAEVDEVRRWHDDQTRMETRRAMAKDDPAVVRLAGILGMSSDAMGLVVGLLFAVILEGTGCLCWFSVLQQRDSLVAVPVTVEVSLPMPAVTEPVVAGAATSRAVAAEIPSGTDGSTAPNGAAKTACEAIDPKRKKLHLLIERVRPEIEAGRVGRTVTAIREFLRCERATAAEVRRALNTGWGSRT